MENLYIEATMIECNEEKREISGKIVPFGTDEIGSTNLGLFRKCFGWKSILKNTRSERRSMP